MALSCVIAFVPNLSVDAFGASETESTSFPNAVNGRASDVYVTQVGLHVLVTSPGNLWEAPILKDDPEGGVLAIIDEDLFAISVFGEGDRVRQVVEGTVQYEEGTPLSVESVFDEISDPELSHLELIARLAGISSTELRKLDWYRLRPWPTKRNKLVKGTVYTITALVGFVVLNKVLPKIFA